MNVVFRYVVLGLAIICIYLIDKCNLTLNQKIKSVSLERPALVEENPALCHVINVTSRRRSRSDPTHYVQIWTELFKALDGGGLITIHVFEFLSNDYRPTFVHTSLPYCNFVTTFISSTFFYTTNLSIPVTKYDLQRCFFKPGIYHIADMSLPLRSLPENFPFTKGRVFINHTYKDKLVMAGRIDIDIKTVPLKIYKGGA